MTAPANPPYASPPASLTLGDCDFYHSMDIPGVGEIVGLWDLRRTVDDYLGDIDFAGKRVLEIGPASGFLTIEMERRGAEIVAVDIPDEVGWDFVPFPEPFLAPLREKQIAGMPRLKNSFWFNHAANKSKARVIYADIYNLPELGYFDVAVLASVLLHCQNPAGIIAECAKRAQSIVITELYHPELTGPVCELVPSPENDTWHTWWRFTPEFFTRYLGVLGFEDQQVSMHQHRHTLVPDRLMPMFSVVGSRRG
jgi:SAM-dependent methyltransferase